MQIKTRMIVALWLMIFVAMGVYPLWSIGLVLQREIQKEFFRWRWRRSVALRCEMAAARFRL